jgi:hypothetical protein
MHSLNSTDMNLRHYYIFIWILLITALVMQDGYGQFLGIPSTGNGNLLYFDISERTSQETKKIVTIGERGLSFSQYASQSDRDFFLQMFSGQTDGEAEEEVHSLGFDTRISSLFEPEAGAALLSLAGLQFDENASSDSEVVLSRTESSTTSGSTLSQLNVSFETISKTLTANTQYAVGSEDGINQLFTVGAKIKGEGDFANLFKDGEISSTGGLSFTYGIGKFIKKKTLSGDLTLREKEGIPTPYWLVSVSLDPQFVNVNTIVNPTASFEKDNTKDTNWQGRLGINGLFNLKNTGILGGLTFSFGQTNNVSSLKTRSLNDVIINGTQNLVSTETVLIGSYQEGSFFNTSIDAFITPSFLRTIGFYGNINWNSFDESDTITTVNAAVYFLKKDDKDASVYKPQFGLVFSWPEGKSLSFGLTSTFQFGKFNVPKYSGTTVTTTVTN